MLADCYKTLIKSKCVKIHRKTFYFIANLPLDTFHHAFEVNRIEVKGK